MQVIINRAMVKAGFESGRFTAHTLRHSFATHLLNQGNNIHVIKTLLGHSKPETRMIYLHLQHHTQMGIVSPLEKLGDGAGSNDATLTGQNLCSSWHTAVQPIQPGRFKKAFGLPYNPLGDAPISLQ